MREEIHIPPSKSGNVSALLYFGRDRKPSSYPWCSAESMLPNEINDVSHQNLKRKNPMSIGTGTTVQEARDNALEKLERRVLKGDYDCIAIVDVLPIRNGALFYCYVDAELYKFRERDWSHPLRKDKPTYERVVR